MKSHAARRPRSSTVVPAPLRGRLRRNILIGVVVVTALLLVAISLRVYENESSAPVIPGNVSMTSWPQPQGVVSRAAPGDTPIGAKWDWGRYSAFTPYLGNLTGSFTTYELVWCQIEKNPGEWRWFHVDKVVSQTRALGIQLGLKVRTGACWATKSGPQSVRGSKGKTESVPPASMKAYELFLRRAVHRYAPLGVTEWAIENEINSEKMWRGSMSDYATLATTAAHVIRSIQPNAVIVDPGLSSSTNGLGVVNWLIQEGHGEQALQVYNTYFAHRTNRRDKLPVVTTLPDLLQVMNSSYATTALKVIATDQSLLDNGVFDVRQVHFYESWVNVPALFAWLRATDPSHTPIEAWETGQYQLDSAASEQERAQEAAKTVTLMLAGGAQRVVWLPLAYSPVGRHSNEPRYGLLDPDGTVRPAGVMIADLAALSRGAIVMPVTVRGLQGVILTRGDVSTLVVWNVDGGNHTFDPHNLKDVTVRPLGRTATTATTEPTPITSTPEVVTATAPPGQLLERLR